MDLGLGGKTVLVTGGSRGIGFEIARAFHHEGADVVICSRNPRHLVDAAKRIGEIAAHPCDVRDPAQVRRLLKRLRRLDVLVNNAGGMEHFKASAGIGEWRSTFELNLFSAVQLTGLALPLLRRSGGCIVNVASEVGRQPFDMGPDYCAAKAAMLSWTRYLAEQVAPGVRVNAVCPGPVLTESWLASNGGSRKRLAADVARSAKRVPLGRVGRPDEIASAVLLLASPRGGFVTGAGWAVDGGAVRSIF